YPSTVKQAGRIAAFTVGLSALSTNATTAQKDIKFLDTTYGGDAQVELTVLKLVGKKNLRSWQVVESSPVVDVQPYLGQVVQFPLTTSLPVTRGETIALTTPTWAPVPSIDLSTSQFAYRPSRSRTCNHPPPRPRRSGRTRRSSANRWCRSSRLHRRPRSHRTNPRCRRTPCLRRPSPRRRRRRRTRRTSWSRSSRSWSSSRRETARPRSPSAR